MYCSSCGSAISPNLTYCNRCGARVNDKLESQAKTADFPESLVAAMVALFIFGLGVVMGLMAVMKKVNFDPPIILAVSFFVLCLLVVLELVFIYLLFSARRATRRAAMQEGIKENTTRELGESHAPMLPEPMPSVTEQTTRAFEPILRERKD
jgi:hypothetical protein